MPAPAALFPASDRRTFLGRSIAACSLGAMAGRAAVSLAGGAVDVPQEFGSRLELFVDGQLIEEFKGQVRQELHHPSPREVVLYHDASWEGTGCVYHSVFQDGDRYRMYYKGSHLEVSEGKLNASRHPIFCCYAE
ncbi:MAG: hypothetical protein KDA45_11175, partial [Planctomycetales bacterium]|nr:hypothetical protein [Planctomycetales bacterium]